ncbi:MAG: PEP-CTERM sorting domain-containing protein [Azonexus sp.]|nr:PEP-CTERM sorting domain-containing protein [Azonexus sp.]
MKIRSLIVAIFAASGIASASAAIQSNDYGSYTMAFDDSSIFGSPSFSFGSDGGVTGFGWTVPNALQVNGFGGAVMATFDLPSFTITANSGYSLSGLTASIRNLSFFSLVSQAPLANASYTVSLNDGLSSFGNMALESTTTSASLPGAPSYGYLGGSTTATNANYSKLMFNGTLFLAVNSPTAVYAQPQNELKFSLIAAAVPEPETYAMFLAGLGLIGGIARRKQIRG